MMKKITIFESYNDTSIGDTAILFGLLSCLQRIDSNLEVNLVLMLSKVNIEASLCYKKL